VRRARHLTPPGRGSLANWMTSRHHRVVVLLIIRAPFNHNNPVQWSLEDGRMGRWRPQAVAPVTRGRGQYLMPTSQFQRNSSSNSSSRPLLRDQARDLFSHQPTSTLLTSVKTLILTKQRQPHITPLLDHSPQVLLFPHSPPPAPRRYSGVMALQPPLRSVQVLSHILQSSNFAQLFLLPSSVHQTIIAMTSPWSLRPVSGLGMK
jgi:hypothetical protein